MPINLISVLELLIITTQLIALIGLCSNDICTFRITVVMPKNENLNDYVNGPEFIV